MQTACGQDVPLSQWDSPRGARHREGHGPRPPAPAAPAKGRDALHEGPAADLSLLSLRQDGSSQQADAATTHKSGQWPWNELPPSAFRKQDEIGLRQVLGPRRAVGPHPHVAMSSGGQEGSVGPCGSHAMPGAGATGRWSAPIWNVPGTLREPRGKESSKESQNHGEVSKSKTAVCLRGQGHGPRRADGHCQQGDVWRVQAG